MNPASSIAEFCKRYKICRTTVYNEARRGRLKIRKLGARSLIMLDDERDWLKSMPTLPAHPLVHSRAVVKREQKRTPVDSGEQQT